MKGSFGIITASRSHEFVRKGYRQRCFFPHSVRYLPKCGPDGFKLARWMLADASPNQLWELVIHAAPSLAGQFPSELFFDDDIVWHQQQFGRTGQIATANLVVQGNELYTMVHISDVVQRISRRRSLKTQIENRFKGWNHMLLNGILDFAVGMGMERIYVANSDWALRHTDPKRNVGPEMFRRVYDENVKEIFEVTSSPPWWSIDVSNNADRVVAPEPGEEDMADEKLICVCHDIERGMGHTDSDPESAIRMDAVGPKNLERMLSIERRLGVNATHSVVGQLVPELRGLIEQDGHCLAFHSYDHRIGSSNGAAPTEDQLGRCRSIDYRLKGYRTPQSKITPELTDENLCFHNFEWLGSSTHSLGFDEPRLENRIVKIPIQFDDYPMFRNGQSYDAWENEAIETIENNRFVAFGLHDCYGELWLPRYAEFLEKIGRLGKLTTMNQVAGDLFLRNAQLHGVAP
ncbi:MAG: hypothetical protein ABI556_03400 [Gemmatimonadales bacterium]